VVRLGLPPLLAVFVECEGAVCVRLFAESEEDKRRMVADIEGRPDLILEVAARLDEFVIELRDRRDAA
jgi:hypothetical protein